MDEGTQIFPWLLVNKLMNDEYREIIVRDALIHYKQTSGSLRKFATNSFAGINVPGFRTLFKAPVSKAAPLVIKDFQQYDRVTTAVICLWAEAQRDVIEDVKRECVNQGYYFVEPWTWQDAMIGHTAFPDDNEFHKIIEQMAEDFESPQKDHILLAELWLSQAFRFSPEEEIEVEIRDENLLANLGLDDPDPESVIDPLDLPPKDPSNKHLISEKPSTQAEEYHPEKELAGKSLSEVLQAGKKILDDSSSGQKSTLGIVKNMQSSAKRGNLEKTSENFILLDDQLAKWNDFKHRKVTFAEFAAFLLSEAFQERPDLEQDKELEESDFSDLLGMMQDVITYDKEKTDQSRVLEQLQTDLATSKAEWFGWLEGTDDQIEADQELSSLDPATNTLANLNSIEANLRDKIEEFATKSQEARDAALVRIQWLIDSLGEHESDRVQIMIAEKTLKEYGKIDIKNLDNQQIRQHLISLETELAQQSLKKQPGKNSDLAAILLKSWESETFYDLIESLAVEHHDSDVYLFLMAVASGNYDGEPHTLSPVIFDCMLDGMASLHSSKHPFDVLGYSLPILLRQYAFDEQTLADLAILSLAVKYRFDYALPDEVLWQIAPEWPESNMPAWKQLWVTTLSGNICPIYSGDKQSELHEQVIQTKSKADSSFSRDGGHYVRLNSIQSKRHLSMMGRLLDEMKEVLDDLDKQAALLGKANEGQIPGLLSRLSNSLTDYNRETLNEFAVQDMYDAGIKQESINDASPFYPKVCVRTLNNIAGTILAYGDALHNYWNIQNQQSSGINGGDLVAELEKLPHTSKYTKIATNMILRGHEENQESWNEVAVLYCLDQLLAQEMLTQPRHSLRHPRFISYIGGSSLNWPDALPILLQNIVEPLQPEEIGKHLLGQKMPNQALLLVKHLSLELQNQAQSMEKEYDRKFVSLTSELLDLGGKIDNLKLSRDIGRWGWVFYRLDEEIKILQELKASDAEKLDALSRKFREEIKSLDDAFFDISNNIPADTYSMLRKCINAAHDVIREQEHFPVLKDLIDDLKYRLEHQSWAMTPIEQSLDQFNNEIYKTSSSSLDRSAKSILDLLKIDDLAALGLSRIETSSVHTRIQVLSNWLKAKNAKSVLSANLLTADITTIQEFFSSFARMMPMDRYYSGSGILLDKTAPMVIENWTLRYPKTAALNNRYVLLILPGNPPSPEDIRNIEEMIEEKEFLEYWLVLLFVPGCTENIYKRLKRKNLTIIDETSLVKFILSEAAGIKPVGALRPMVLNATEGNSDVFVVNQSVNSRTAIFIGRDMLVSQLAQSGDNYAIYGGRRIGKSSVLKAVRQRLDKRGYQVAFLSLEGEPSFKEEDIQKSIAKVIGISEALEETGSFKEAITNYMESNPVLHLAILLDEVDRYIAENPKRHTLIEALRSCSDQFDTRFRVIVAGFMHLYDALQGRGPYTPNSDPWQRMFTNSRELENLSPRYAEQIVREGFVSVLGWEMDRAIPQRIVEHTGGHPAFVQAFCLKLLERIRARRDHKILPSDLDAVFQDNDPDNSFIAYVRDTLRLNLDPLSNYLILYLVIAEKDQQGFTRDEIRNIAETINHEIPEELLDRSLELLKVTSVIRERIADVYDFTVPDYISILDRLSSIADADQVEEKLVNWLKKHQ